MLKVGNPIIDGLIIEGSSHQVQVYLCTALLPGVIVHRLMTRYRDIHTGIKRNTIDYVKGTCMSTKNQDKSRTIIAENISEIGQQTQEIRANKEG